METYIVRIFTNTFRTKKDVVVKAMNANTLRKRIIKEYLNKEYLNKDAVISISKVLKDRDEFMGSMAVSVNGKNVMYRVASSSNKNSDHHLVNPKNGKLDEVSWRD